MAHSVYDKKILAADGNAQIPFVHAAREKKRFFYDIRMEKEPPRPFSRPENASVRVWEKRRNSFRIFTSVAYLQFQTETGLAWTMKWVSY